jgi:hypothetical protein
MTLPSVLRAANAALVEKIRVTPVDRLVATLDESPPVLESPQVMTLPSVLRAANAPSLRHCCVVLSDVVVSVDNAAERAASAQPKSAIRQAAPIVHETTKRFDTTGNPKALLDSLDNPRITPNS